MIRIVADSSSLYSKNEGKEKGISIAPLAVNINGQTYKEFEDINTYEFIEIINKGHIPSSSQPSIGEVLEIYEQYKEDEIINISMADGLSGTYNSACMAKGMAENPERIDVINSKTLCGPHRYLVNLAAELVKQGKTKQEIVNEINNTLEDTKSYLIPHDFDFLVRGGRVSALVGKIGSAIKKIVEEMLENNVDSNCKIYISHACKEDLAEDAKKFIMNSIENADIEINLLSPAFTTQGGPGCVAIQYIRKHESLK